MESEPLLSEGFGERLVRWLPKTTHVVQCILGYPNLDYLTSQLSKRKISQATSTFTKATWVVAIAKSCKMAFFNRQSNAECQKYIDYRREPGY